MESATNLNLQAQPEAESASSLRARPAVYKEPVGKNPLTVEHTCCFHPECLGAGWARASPTRRESPSVPMREGGGSPVSHTQRPRFWGVFTAQRSACVVSLRIDQPGVCPELHHTEKPTQGSRLSPSLQAFCSILSFARQSVHVRERRGALFLPAAARMPSQAALGLSWTGIRRPIGDPIEWLAQLKGLAGRALAPASANLWLPRVEITEWKGDRSTRGHFSLPDDVETVASACQM
jgi:hypothetical protein